MKSVLIRNLDIQRLLILGAKGRLGAEFCRFLGDLAISADISQCDLCNSSILREYLQHHRPSVVVNCAAFTCVDLAEDQPDECWRVNAEGVENLAAICRDLSIRLVQISTDYVFGAEAMRSTPYQETESPGPLNVYGRSKLAGEQAVAKLSDSLIVRTCGLYGPSDSSSGKASFVETMLKLADSQQEIRVVNDQFCSPSYVPHVVQGILRLMDSRATGIFHVVNPGEVCWYDFAAEIFRQTKKQVTLRGIPSLDYPTRAVRPAYSCLSMKRYEDFTGDALPSWREALAEYFHG